MRMGFKQSPDGAIHVDRPIEQVSLEIEHGLLVRILVLTDEGVIGIPGPLVTRRRPAPA